jgi:glycosyltransferase involved in cell wall biosynthesis
MISVIIPTRNRADLLGPCLASLSLQSPNVECEVLVIDNGSTDTTQEVVKDFQSKLPNLMCIYAQEPGLHNGRHVGMKAAKGDILVFADDDIEALPTWLSSIDEAFKDPSVAMVGGNNYPMFLDEPPKWLNKLWERRAWRGIKSVPSLSIIEFLRKPELMSPYLVWGCNFSIRKNVLMSAGGFHPDGMPKDLIRFRGDGETHVSNFVARSGLKCIFHSGASVCHKVTAERMTHQYFRQRGFNQGISDSYTALRNQGSTDNLKSDKTIAIKARQWLAKFAQLFDDTEVRKAFDERKAGYREGYAYHQAAYRNDPEVRDWVHHPVYF